MSILRIGALALLTQIALPAGATTIDAAGSEPTRFFAACAGRLSAELEFHWLMTWPNADLVEERRAAMLDILAAVTTHGTEGDVLSWRINAKMAHAALLTRAFLNEDAEDARWAAVEAAAQRQSCTGMLLG